MFEPHCLVHRQAELFSPCQTQRVYYIYMLIIVKHLLASGLQCYRTVFITHIRILAE